MATANGTTTAIDTEAGRWATLQEAAAALGMSRDSVRRRVAARVLRAERRRTVRGLRLFVWLPAGGVPNLADLEFPQDAADDAPRGGDDAAHSGADSARGGAVAQRGAALSQDRAQDMAAYTAALLEPLHARLEAQAERIGRLEAELAAARAATPQTQSAAPERPERRSWWRWLMGG